MASYELWYNGNEIGSIMNADGEYTEAWTLIDGVPTQVWGKSGGGGGGKFVLADSTFVTMVDLDNKSATTIYNINANYSISFAQNFFGVVDSNAKLILVYDLNANKLGYFDSNDFPSGSGFPRNSKGEVFKYTRYVYGLTSYSFSIENGITSRDVPFNKSIISSFSAIYPVISVRYEDDYNNLDYFAVVCRPTYDSSKNHCLIIKGDDEIFVKDLGINESSNFITTVFTNTSYYKRMLNNGDIIVSYRTDTYLIDKNFESIKKLELPTDTRTYTTMDCLYYDEEEQRYIAIGYVASVNEYYLLYTTDFVDYTEIKQIPWLNFGQGVLGKDNIGLRIFEGLRNSTGNTSLIDIETSTRTNPKSFAYVVDVLPNYREYYLLYIPDLLGDIENEYSIIKCDGINYNTN